MAIGDLRHAVGVFPTRQEAEMALRELRDAGFNMDKISVVTKYDDIDRLGSAAVGKTPAEQAGGGAKAGATAGTATGGVLGLIGSLGVLAIPGVGPVAEVGILLANTLLGGALGAAGGGLIGALIGWGVPEEKARYYDERVAEGEYIVLFEGTDVEVGSAEAVLNKHGVKDWGVYGTPGTPTSTRMGMM